MENEEKECPACARCEVSLSDYPNWCRCNSSALRDCVNRLNNYDAGIVFGMHFGDPDFVLEGDPNPAKENILFFKRIKSTFIWNSSPWETRTLRKSIFQ